MSQQAVPYPPYVMVPMRESNGLGVAGFFIALIGLFIPTGIVALLGLLVSLVALGRPPRLFASMGVMLGLVGAVIWIVITGLVVLGAVAAAAVALIFCVAMFIITQPEIIEVTSDMINVTLAAVEYEDEHGTYPEDLDELGLSVSTLTDPWGNPYRYRLSDLDPGFDILSVGSDGEVGTSDDYLLSHMKEVWANAFENLGAKMEEFGERMERLEGRNIHFERSAHAVAWDSNDYEAAAIAAAIAESIAAEHAAEDLDEGHATPVIGPFDDEPEADEEAKAADPDHQGS